MVGLVPPLEQLMEVSLTPALDVVGGMEVKLFLGPNLALRVQRETPLELMLEQERE